MQINQNNYGMFFLDYWEKNLDETGKISLSRFLERNPDLQDEFLEFKEVNGLILMPEEGIGFGDKNVLKRNQITTHGTIDENNFDNHIIAHFEGDHSLRQQQEFDVFILKNPHLERDLKLYKSTFLVADKGIAFVNKQGLKKSLLIAFRTNYFYYSVAVAAIFLLAFFVFNPLNRIDYEMHPQGGFAEAILQNSEKAMEEGLIASDVERGTSNLPEISTEMLSENIENEDVLLNEKIAAVDVTEVEKTNVRNAFQTNIDQLNSTIQISEIEHQDIATTQILPRTEMSEVFDDLLLRDAMQSHENEKEVKGAFGRVFDNIGRQLFGTSLNSDESLLADMAQQGKERFTEFVEQSPTLSTSVEHGKKETYFSLSDNISFRISKADNADKLNE